MSTSTPFRRASKSPVHADACRTDLRCVADQERIEIIVSLARSRRRGTSVGVSKRGRDTISEVGTTSSGREVCDRRRDDFPVGASALLTHADYAHFMLVHGPNASFRSDADADDRREEGHEADGGHYRVMSSSGRRPSGRG